VYESVCMRVRVFEYVCVASPLGSVTALHQVCAWKSVRGCACVYVSACV